MAIAQFKGFSGVRLEAEVLGDDHDPAILLVHGGGQTRAVWAEVAEGLVQSGRRVVNLDLRGHGGSEWPADGRYDFQAFVEDLRAVLSQLGCRPVIVAATLGGWIATVALEQDAALLAAGLVLVDLPTEIDPANMAAVIQRLRERLAVSEGPPAWDERILDSFDNSTIPARLAAAAGQVAVPVLFVRGGLSHLTGRSGAEALIAALPSVESVEVADADLLVVTDRTEAFLGLLLDFLERQQPRAATEFRAGTDARTLRDAMGCFATGITIVTALEPDGQPIGLTANSFTSLSLDPPLLLLCIANNANSAAVLRSAEHFGVNVLQIGQQPASNRFAGKGEDRFAGIAWTPGETGVPLLDGSLGSFECRRHALHDGGDHFILVGEVSRAQFEPRRDPLLYFRGKYRRLHFA